jgi:hypothetical protein
MDKKLIIIATMIFLVLITIVAFIALKGSLSNPMAEVTNMQLAYGQQTIMGFSTGVTSPVLTFSVKNTHDSYLTVMGLTVNGIDYGQQPLQIPPGQTQSESSSLTNLALSSGANYQVKLTFTFADGKYETYSEACAAPQFRGDAQITTLSLTAQSGGFGLFSSYHVEIQNTGNLPITSATCTIQGYTWELTLVTSGMPLLPGKTANTGWGGIMTNHEAGKSYSVSIPITFQDGSSKTLQTSVIAQSAA